MRRDILRTWGSTLVMGTLALVASFFAVRALRGGNGTTNAALGRVSRVYEDSVGPQLVLVYIGKSTCAWCRHRDLPGLLDTAQSRMTHFATAQGISYASVAVSVDHSPHSGLSHLQDMGAFTEYVAGGGWSGVSVAPYVWEHLPGQAATPQVLVFYRWVSKSSAAGDPVLFTIDSIRQAGRFVGLREIAEWTRTGNPLPTFAAR